MGGTQSHLPIHLLGWTLTHFRVVGLYPQHAEGVDDER